MMIWRSFGASEIGPGHLAASMPNQDAWTSFHRVWGDGIVVSDGLGSKPFSNVGSEATCRAVMDAIRICCQDNAELKRSIFFDQIKNGWLSRIAPLEPRDCSATCLFAFCHPNGMIRVGMLGDGLAAVVKTDGSIVVLSEDKSEGFSNITVAISPNVTEKDWLCADFSDNDCEFVFLCTDGVADDLEDINGFIKGFVETHRRLSSISAARRIREMLANWPTPKHSDDKTIACLLREEDTDE